MTNKKSDIPENHLVVFQEKAIRRTWYNEAWWFSVVDVCGVLTESPDAGAYWRKLKQRLGAEGSEVVTFCHELKLQAGWSPVTPAGSWKQKRARQWLVGRIIWLRPMRNLPKSPRLLSLKPRPKR